MESEIRYFEVTKQWGDHQVGEVISNEGFDESVTVESLATLIADGILMEVTAHVVTEEDISANPDAGLVLGDTIHLPLVTTAAPEEQAAIDAEVKKREEEAAASLNAPTEVKDSSPLVYRGKEVVRDSVRVVEGKEYHHIQLASGESLDITDAEYAEMTIPK